MQNFYLGKNEQWKGNLINDIIRESNFYSYLELGVDKGSTYNLIYCKKKVGVDTYPKFEGLVKSTTSDFFINNEDFFDLIYIDACHEKYQVLEDFKNSYSFLSENGIIIFHDINPPTLSTTLSTFCGNVYEFWIELEKYAKIHVFEYVDGDTVGIFLKSENPSLDLELLPKEFDHDWDTFTEKKKDIIDSKNLNYTDLISLSKENKKNF